MASSRALSLHHLCLMDQNPIQLVQVAGDAGFEHVCIFTQPTAGLDFPLVTRENEPAFRQAMRDTGVSVYNIEVFFLTPELHAKDHREALALGASLGGKRATAFLAGGITDAEAIDEFGKFCDLAQEMGVEASLEFMVFNDCKTIDHAMRIIRGANHANGKLAIDALHLYRNGVGPADFDRLNVRKDEIGYIQFCDGPLTVDPDKSFYEATANRMAPSHGAFALDQFLAHMPEGRTLSIECPMDRPTDTPRDKAKLLNRSAREVLARFEPR
ncbi:MAG: TIM barrel protein [Caulobacterales bacterium]